MSPRDRLQAAQLELDARRIKIGGLTFAEGANKLTFDELATSVAEFVEAYLRGEYRVINVQDAQQAEKQADRLNWGD